MIRVAVDFNDLLHDRTQLVADLSPGDQVVDGATVQAHDEDGNTMLSVVASVDAAVGLVHLLPIRTSWQAASDPKTPDWRIEPSLVNTLQADHVATLSATSLTITDDVVWEDANQSAIGLVPA